jgi:hypothetical protein
VHPGAQPGARLFGMARRIGRGDPRRVEADRARPFLDLFFAGHRAQNAGRGKSLDASPAPEV